MTTQQLSAPAPAPTTTALQRALADRFGGLPRTFWIIFSGTIANRIGDMVVPFLVFFLGSRGVNTAQTGSIVIALGLGGLGGPVLGGWLADRVGRRFALIAGLVATPASLGFLFAAPSVLALGAAAALLGLAGKLFTPAAAALISDAVDSDVRPKAFSLMHWAVNIGTAVAAASAGFLAGSGFGLLFIVDAVTCLAFAAIVVFGIKSQPRPAATAAKQSTGYGIVFRDKLMIGFLVLTITQTMVYSMTEFAIPLAIRLDGLTPQVFGLVAVINAVGVVALQPLLYTWLASLGRIRVMAASYLLVGVGVAATGLAHEPWQYAITTVIWTVGEVAGGMVIGGIAADLAPEEARGRYQGAMSWAWSVARLLAPALTTGLFTTVGPAALWWVTAALGIGGAVVAIRMTTVLNARTGRV